MVAAAPRPRPQHGSALEAAPLQIGGGLGGGGRVGGERGPSIVVAGGKVPEVEVELRARMARPVAHANDGVDSGRDGGHPKMACGMALLLEAFSSYLCLACATAWLLEMLSLPSTRRALKVVNHGQCLSKTSSRCLTDSVTAMHDFEVASYPLINGMGVGKFVSSSVFSVGGYDWNIRFYPDGLTETDSAGNASAFLCHLSPAKDVRTKFTLNLLEKEGKVQVTTFDVLEHIFSPASDWGYPKFVEKTKLKSSTHINTGYLTIRCVLTVIKESRTEAKRNLIVAPQPNLQDHLVHMLKDGEGADVTFIVSGQLFSAHRCLLAARSLVFKAELFGPMKEKTTQFIKIDDIEPAVFEALLHFVYTDSMQDDAHYKEGKIAKLQHLLVAADRYGLDRLRVMCEVELSESIDVETVATTLVLANQHHCSDLQKACIEFMAPRDVLRAVMKEILEKVSRSD